LSQADCFRICHIGNLNASDVQALMDAIAQVLIEMDINLTKIEA
jgi:aspartate aminotransferase-like enzyme